MEEVIICVVVILISAINVWLVKREAKRIDNASECTRVLEENFFVLRQRVTKLEYNPAIEKAKREKKIQSLEHELKVLKEKQDN